MKMGSLRGNDDDSSRSQNQGKVTNSIFDRYAIPLLTVSLDQVKWHLTEVPCIGPELGLCFDIYANQCFFGVYSSASVGRPEEYHKGEM